MPNRSQPFHQHHVQRALKAAVRAGVPNPSVEVRLPSGAVIAVTGSAGSKPDAPKPDKGRPAVAPAKKGK
jgi:hypothetical protein